MFFSRTYPYTRRVNIDQITKEGTEGITDRFPGRINIIDLSVMPNGVGYRVQSKIQDRRYKRKRIKYSESKRSKQTL